MPIDNQASNDIDIEVVRKIIAEVLEVGPEKIHGSTHFLNDLNADSLRIIEILARLEAGFKVTIDQSLLARMVTLDAVCDVTRASMNVEA